jgi:hypothetical protein
MALLTFLLVMRTTIPTTTQQVFLPTNPPTIPRTISLDTLQRVLQTHSPAIMTTSPLTRHLLTIYLTILLIILLALIITGLLTISLPLPPTWHPAICPAIPLTSIQTMCPVVGSSSRPPSIQPEEATTSSQASASTKRRPCLRPYSPTSRLSMPTSRCTRAAAAAARNMRTIRRLTRPAQGRSSRRMSRRPLCRQIRT